jgi:hypothetical protein
MSFLRGIAAPVSVSMALRPGSPVRFALRWSVTLPRTRRNTHEFAATRKASISLSRIR